MENPKTDSRTVISISEGALFAKRPEDFMKEYVGECGNPCSSSQIKGEIKVIDGEKKLVISSSSRQGKEVILSFNDLIKLECAFPPMGHITIKELLGNVTENIINDRTLDMLMVKRMQWVRETISFVLGLARMKKKSFEGNDETVAYIFDRHNRVNHIHAKDLIKKLATHCDQETSSNEKDEGGETIGEIVNNYDQMGNLTNYPENVVGRAYTWIRIWCAINGCDLNDHKAIKEALNSFPHFDDLIKQPYDERFGDDLIDVVEQMKKEGGWYNEN